MKRSAIVLVLASLVIGCSSGGSAGKVNLLPPEYQVRQISGQAHVARHVSGGMPVQFAMDFRNPSGETIVLERIQVESMGSGAYSVEPVSRPFDTNIAPNQVITVNFWAPAIAGSTILGANGPVTLRTTAYFSSAFGKFREIYIQQVNSGQRENRIPH
jgi:hypothetical protein